VAAVPAGQGAGDVVIEQVAAWLGDPAHWQGADGIPTHLREHLGYSVVAVLLATAIALPLGLYVGHTGRGTFLISGIANSLRALPTLGLLILFVILLAPRISSDLVYLLPSEAVLAVLAVPPMLTNAYAGVQNVPASARDAAVGMGMTGRQVLWRVEVPCAAPLILSGIRSAALQCIATATVAAYVSLGGFGRYVVDGLAQQDYPKMASGALLVAALALLADGLLAVVQRLVVSPGVSGRFGRRTGRSETPTGSRTTTAARHTARAREVRPEGDIAHPEDGELLAEASARASGPDGPQ
jgi:osmoprotectant transport system permease protein